MEDAVKKLSEYVICPVCKSKLKITNEELYCSKCDKSFPIVGKIPILINENNSLFKIEDFLNKKNTTFKSIDEFKLIISNYLPSISINIKSKENYYILKKYLQKSKNPKVLIIGGSVLGKGMEELIKAKEIDFIEGDVSFGSRTQIIFDAHNIPFANDFFDCVIVQAVLEHVLNPQECVKEIHRVLKFGGYVYSETPFMQQVHMGQYDFTRFTYLGHRYLFKNFEEIGSGAVCGPAMALSWAYQYFMLSFTQSERLRLLIQVFCRLTSFWIKYFDLFLIRKTGSLDASSGFYFFGFKSNDELTGHELIELYKGGQK